MPRTRQTKVVSTKPRKLGLNTKIIERIEFVVPDLPIPESPKTFSNAEAVTILMDAYALGFKHKSLDINAYFKNNWNIDIK